VAKIVVLYELLDSDKGVLPVQRTFDLIEEKLLANF